MTKDPQIIEFARKHSLVQKTGKPNVTYSFSRQDGFNNYLICNIIHFIASFKCLVRLGYDISFIETFNWLCVGLRKKPENTVVLFRGILLPAVLLKQDIAAC